MPFILDDTDSEDDTNEKRAQHFLTRINVSFCIFATVVIAANTVWRHIGTSSSSDLIRLRLFDILPYLVLVGVLIYSICKIKLMVRHYDLFSTRNGLMCFMILCFISYALNWIFILPVSWLNESIDEGKEGNKMVEFIFHIVCILFELLSTILLLLIVYLLYSFTNNRHLKNFGTMLDNTDKSRLQTQSPSSSRQTKNSNTSRIRRITEIISTKSKSRKEAHTTNVTNLDREPSFLNDLVNNRTTKRFEKNRQTD